MKFESLLKAAPFSGTRVKPFEGIKRYLSTGDLQGDTFTFVDVDFKSKPSRADIIVETGDVLFARMKGTKKVLQITPDLASTIVSTGFAVVRPERRCDPAYLATYLNTDLFERQKEKYCSGAIQPAITNGGIEKLEIPLPDLNDQIRIAHLLGKVEGLIAQRKQHLQQLDDLLKSVFLEMFGDPVRNVKGWDTEPLGNLAKIERGRFSPRPRNDPKFFTGDYPFIQTGDINRSNGRLFNYTQTLNELGIKVSKEFGVGTIVIAIVGATIGETAILQLPVYAPDSVIGITHKQEDKEESIFIEFLLRFWKPVLKARAPQAARANINIETLRPIPIIWPNELDRKKFATITEKVEALKSRYQQSLDDLESLYAALSQQAFKGELDLSQVPLPESEQTSDEVVAIVPETEAQTADKTIAVHLPESHALPDALTDKAKRKDLFAFWLESYCQQIGNTPFSASDFLAAAQNRVTELHPDSEFEMVANDYDMVKDWVFENIRTRQLKQTREIIFMNEKGKFGNRVLLRARRQLNQ